MKKFWKIEIKPKNYKKVSFCQFHSISNQNLLKWINDDRSVENT